MIEVKAVAKNVKGSPRKARIVADQVRGKSALFAVEALRYMPKGAALPVRKALESAIANAVNNRNLDAQSLVVTRISVDAAPMYKRQIAESKGRARLILKRNSHITVYVADKNQKVEKEALPAMPVEAEVIDETKTETKKKVTTKPAAAKKPATTKAASKKAPAKAKKVTKK